MNEKTTHHETGAAKVGLLLLVGVAVVVAGFVGWWFLRDDAPEEVNLNAAVENIAEESQTNTQSEPIDDITGIWTVDTESGEFDYESATGSFAGFRVEEELKNVGSVTAVGRTGDIDGTITIADDTLTEAVFTIDMSTVTTDDSRRDNKLQQALETTEFPTAEFVLSEPVELGDTAVEGESISATAKGELTIHGVTQNVELSLDAQLAGNTIVVVGSSDITFADYDVEPPTAPIVLSLEESGIIEFQFLFTK